MKSPKPFRTIVLVLILSTPLLAQTTAPAPIPRPNIPGRIFAITDFGALGDNKTVCTDALKQAIAACTKAGGGTILVPATEAGGATFLTGPITLANNTELRVDKGAILQFSANPDDYPIKSSHHTDLLSARGLHDVAITGEGTIDGAGAPWWKAYTRPAKPAPGAAASPAAPAAPAPTARRPYLLQISGCQRLLLENITIANSPSVALGILTTNDVTIDHIKISAPDGSPNTDGINVAGQNISITHSTFDTGEDDICIKPVGEGTPDHPECANIRIADCTIQHGKGIVIGGQTTGCLRGLSVSNTTFDETQYGIRMRADRGRGGLCEDLAYDNITMNNVKFPIYLASYFPTIPKNAATDPAQSVTPVTPIWKNIRISNLTANGCLTAGSIVGLPELPIADVTLSNINITATRAMEITHAKNIQFSNAHINVTKGKPVLTTDAQVTGIDNLSSPADALP